MNRDIGDLLAFLAIGFLVALVVIGAVGLFT